MIDELRIDDEERRERTQLRAAFWQVKDMAMSRKEEMIRINRLAVGVVEGILMLHTNLALRSTGHKLVTASKIVRCQ